MLVGVLRAVTRRMLTPPAWNTGSGTSTPWSTAEPGITAWKSVRRTPWEPTTSLKSRSTADSWKSGFCRRWNGKSPGTSVSFGPRTWKVTSPPRVPGLTLFFVRLSAPAWKWQLAQAWTPSLPACISQKSAFPSLMAAGLLLTNWNRLGGSGTAIWFRGNRVGGGMVSLLAPGGTIRVQSSSVASKRVVFDDFIR